MRTVLSLLLLLLATSSLAERKTTYFHTDALGSVVAATNESGQVIWRKDYAPYGEQIDSTPEAEKLSYTGKQHDDVTGLTYFGARYYDPQIGRFTSVDPAGIRPGAPRTFNRYAYANNNPFRFLDPDGRDAVEIEYKGYMVQTGTFLGRRPLGHGGVLLINEKTGLTKYYEYGRYAGAQAKGRRLMGKVLAGNSGNIRKVDVPNVEIGPDGKATQESLTKVYDVLSKAAGQGKEVEADYHDGADFDAMDQFVKKLADDENRDRYSVLFNSCFDFADDVADEGRRAEKEAKPKGKD